MKKFLNVLSIAHLALAVFNFIVYLVAGCDLLLVWGPLLVAYLLDILMGQIEIKEMLEDKNAKR